MSKHQLHLEELRGLAALAAQRAASCLTQMSGCRLAAGEARSDRRLSRERGPWETGLFFEVEGGFGGVVALMLAPGAPDALLKALLRSGGDDTEAAESALRELGNIVASQAISTIAHEIGDRLLPSVPILSWRGVESGLAALIRRRGIGPDAPRFECLLEDRSSGLRILFVLAPDGSTVKPDGARAGGV